MTEKLADWGWSSFNIFLPGDKLHVDGLNFLSGSVA